MTSDFIISGKFQRFYASVNPELFRPMHEFERASLSQRKDNQCSIQCAQGTLIMLFPVCQNGRRVPVFQQPVQRERKRAGESAFGGALHRRTPHYNVCSRLPSLYRRSVHGPSQLLAATHRKRFCLVTDETVLCR